MKPICQSCNKTCEWETVRCPESALAMCVDCMEKRIKDLNLQAHLTRQEILEEAAKAICKQCKDGNWAIRKVTDGLYIHYKADNTVLGGPVCRARLIHKLINEQDTTRYIAEDALRETEA